MFNSEREADLTKNLQEGIAILRDIASPSVWDELVAYGERAESLRTLIRGIDGLEWFLSASKRNEIPRLWKIRIYRKLLSFDHKAFVRILLMIALQDDEKAIIPWRLELHQRKATELEKYSKTMLRSVTAQEKKIRREDSVVFRVIDLRHHKKITLKQALQEVANNDDLSKDNFISTAIRHYPRTFDAVRKDYMAGIKRAKLRGEVSSGKAGLFGGKKRTLPLGELTRKGRKPARK